MTFPLGPGCRKVCRPARSVPRQMEPKDVARLAKATVKNGYSQCEVLAAVKEVVKCPQCEKEIAEVDEGLQALEEDAKELLDAILKLLDALGIPTRAEVPEKGAPEPSWWRKLLRMFNVVSKIRGVVVSIIEIYEAVKALNATVQTLIADVRELMKCCKG